MQNVTGEAAGLKTDAQLKHSDTFREPEQENISAGCSHLSKWHY